jgi:hypothetical protein
MCITVNEAKLSKTKILSLPIDNGRHFIAYSNKVINTSGKPNAMILPIPGNTKPEWFHNTEKYKGFIDEIIDKCQMKKYEGWEERGFLSKGLSDELSFETFELGMYTVGLAKDFSGIREFIDQLPEEKRPEISEELKEFFETQYAGWSFAVCVFGSDKAIDAQPIAFEYEPFAYNLIYFPTVDSHNGKAPNLNDFVDVDHTFIYEHTGEMTKKYYQNSVVLDTPEIPVFLKEKRYRAIDKRGMDKNADTFIKGIDMEKSNFKDEPLLYRIKPVPHLVS